MFAVTGATWKRGGAASSLRLETRHAASSGDCVGVGLDEERRDMEWTCCYAGRVGSPGAGGNNRTGALAPVGYLATSPLISGDGWISGLPVRGSDRNFGSFGECPDAIIWTEFSV